MPASRRVFLAGTTALIAAPGLGCDRSPGESVPPIPPELEVVLRPFLVILPVIKIGRFVVNTIITAIERRKRWKALQGNYEIGQGTSLSEDWDDEGLELPEPFIAAYRRVMSNLDSNGKQIRNEAGFTAFTNPGKPILPVVTARSTESELEFEGQFFESDSYGRRMRFLFVRGHDTKTVRPIPEAFANEYLKPERCFGKPISDPEWHICSGSGCGVLQVTQRFMSFPDGLIATAFPSTKDPTHKHDYHGEEIGEGCQLFNTGGQKTTDGSSSDDGSTLDLDKDTRVGGVCRVRK